MNQEKLNQIALELMRLGISQAGVADLMATSPLEEIERQLLFLPHRKAKRPGAFLIDAVRNHYSPPKEFYAPTQAHPSTSRNPVDEDPAGAHRPPDAQTQGHGASDSAAAPAQNPVPLPEVRATVDLAIPLAHLENRTAVGSHQQSDHEP